MKIQVTDKSRNGEVVITNYNAQRKVERQLNEILARIEQRKAELRSVL